MDKARQLIDKLISEDHCGVAALLARGQYDVNFILPEGAAPIHIAAGLDSTPLYLLRLFLLCGANPNLQSSEGETPLHVSASNDMCDVLRLLLLNGADPDIENQDGQTALDFAREFGCDMCILTLEEFSKPQEDDADETAFSIEPYEPDIELPFSPKKMISSHTNSLQERETMMSNQQGDIFSNNEKDCSTSFYSVSSREDLSVIPEVDEENLTVSTQHLSVRYPTNKDPADGDLPLQSANSTYTLSARGSVAKRNNGESNDITFVVERGSRDPPESTGHSASTTVLPAQKAHKSEKSRYNERADGDTSKICKEKDLSVVHNDTVSSCGTADLIPKDFNPDDLSLDLHDERDDPFNLAIHMESLNLETDVESKEACPRTNDTQRAHEGWFSKIRNLWHQTRNFPTGNIIDRLNPTSSHTTKSDHVTQDLYAVSEGMSSIQTNRVKSSDLYADECNGDQKCSLMTTTALPSTSCSRKHLPSNKEGSITGPALVFPRKDHVSDIDEWPLTSSRRSSDENSGRLEQFSQTISTIEGSLCSRDAGCPAPVFTSSLRGPRPHLSPDQQAQKGHAVSAKDENGEDRSQSTGLCLRTDFPEATSMCTCGGPVCGSSRRNSSLSSTGTIQYLYTDVKDGYSLIETWYPLDEATQAVMQEDQSDHSTLTACGQNRTAKCETSSQKEPGSDAESRADICQEGIPVPDKITVLTDSELRAELTTTGHLPGPITQSTRWLYERRLAKLLVDPTAAASYTSQSNQGYLPELAKVLSDQLETSSLQHLEDEMSEPFYNPDPLRKWREGTRKSAFNYLLLDSRITENLPARVKILGHERAFEQFLEAIFYVGKGKRARPYAHFKEAVQYQHGTQSKPPGAKVRRILDIWHDGVGVVSLHMFQNVISVEAFTREAAIIEALGLKRLTNVKTGEYYGPAANWCLRKKRMLGVRLLHKAFRILLSEGERQIRPADIQA